MLLGPFSLGLRIKFRVLPRAGVDSCRAPSWADHAEHQSGRTQSPKACFLAFPAQWYVVTLHARCDKPVVPSLVFFMVTGISSHESWRYYLGASLSGSGRGLFF